MIPYRLDDEISAEREEFIHQNLQVPLSWIAKAKATRAAFEGRSGDQAWFLIRASEWNAAHEVVVKEIAPDAIIADNYEFFYELLKELEEASESITNWNIGGDFTRRRKFSWPYFASDLVVYPESLNVFFRFRVL